jgi:hypothetical protein
VEVTRGSGGATKEITPIIASIPTPITKEYILGHWIKRPWVQLIEGLIEPTIAWAETTSTLIAAGEDQAGGVQLDEEPPPPPAPSQPAPRGNGRRQAVEDLL